MSRRDCQFILEDDGTVRPEPDMLKWATWLGEAMTTGRTRIAFDKTPAGAVSTIFNGFDVGALYTDLPPRIWESMVWGGRHDGLMEKYASREEALAGHRRLLALLQETPDQQHAESREALGLDRGNGNDTEAKPPTRSGTRIIGEPLPAEAGRTLNIALDADQRVIVAAENGAYILNADGTWKKIEPTP